MGHFEKRGNFGGNKRFGGGGFGGGEKPEMHQATCADCGNTCEVPFKPNGKKPVYCRDCFRKEEGGNDFKKFDKPRRDFGGREERPRFEEKRMFEATCSECGNRCEVPFRPSGEKPVYCNNCFAASRGDSPRGDRNESRGGDNFFENKKPEFKKPEVSKAEFDALNSKLDRILKTLEIIQGKKEFVIDKPAAKAEKPAVIAKPVEKPAIAEKPAAKEAKKEKAEKTVNKKKKKA
jgi:CxxC-x17-CxxC domain-containing protein